MHTACQCWRGFASGARRRSGSAASSRGRLLEPPQFLARLRVRGVAPGCAAHVRVRLDRLPRELGLLPALALTRVLPDSGLGLYLKLALATWILDFWILLPAV